MSLASPSPADLGPLLEATVRRFVSPAARVVGWESSTLAGGSSGAKVRRHLVTLDEPGGTTAVRLVTKEATPLERRVLALLNAQGHACVPYAHALEGEEEDVALLCLEDLGDENRPNSRAEFDEAVFESEAAGLAGIHAANLGQGEALAWLPRADRAYYKRMLEHLFFRPAWKRALADDAFLAEFGDRVPTVEAAAGRAVDEMAALWEEGDALTLVHTDLNPGNVLVANGRARVVDWGTAHYGPLYLDVPHHFFTPDLAERYRRALERRGVAVSPGDFVERWRAAARYTALRYMWWTLEAWREDRGMTGWVRHYLDRLQA